LTSSTNTRLLAAALPVLALLPALGMQPARAADPAKPAAGEIRGDLLYHNYCSVCHGDRGDGQSRARNALEPPPRDFTHDSALKTMTREYMTAITLNGKPGTAMVGWSTQLSKQEAEAVVDYIDKTFMAPRKSPAFAKGKATYAAACATCHGNRAQGASIGPMKTRSLTTPQARVDLSREAMIAAVQGANHRNSFQAQGSKLSDTDLIASVDYMRVDLMAPEPAAASGTIAHGGRASDPARGASPAAVGKAGAGNAAVAAAMALPLPKGLTGNAARGKTFFDRNCAECHGAKGDGQGPRAYFINPKPRNFLTAESRGFLNRPALFAGIAAGKLGSEMPAWDKVIDDQQIADVAEYVYTAFIRPGASKTAEARK
jgi:mono/diheme cytochrome c family protein